MEQLPDSRIPCTRAPNPILDPRAELRLAKYKTLFTPSMPLNVIKRAQEAATATGVTLLLVVGLAAKLTHSARVRIKPALLEQVGLSEDQAKRAAAALSEGGLIEVNSAPGRRREITIIDSDLLQWLEEKPR